MIDSGASRSLSPLCSDFITFTSVNSKISGVGAQASIKGVGMVQWKITDQNGVSHTIETMAYFVPAESIPLYSPQFHFHENLRARGQNLGALFAPAFMMAPSMCTGTKRKFQILNIKHHLFRLCFINKNIHMCSTFH